MSGVILVALTWILSLGAVCLTGFGLVSILERGAGKIENFRRSLWWGLALCLLVILIISTFQPLKSSASALILLSVVAIGTLVSGVMLINRSRKLTKSRINVPAITVLLSFLAVVLIAYFAVAALGPVTNYDSGLYHLGAIKYASDYSTIPGLANLYFPFGYNTSMFPFAAIFGNGPWNSQGYRLANGFIIVLVLVDLLARWGRKKKSVGAYVLLVGVVVALVPMITFADYWVTSPTADSCVLMLFIVAIAYWADAIWANEQRVMNQATSLILAIVMVSLRPLMGVFLVALLITFAAFVSRRQFLNRGSVTRKSNAAVPWIVVCGLGLGFLAVQTIRDYILSGWIQFPLSIYGFNVPWISADPVWNRTPTLGAARDPQHLWDATRGFEWVTPWLKALPHQWEFYMLLLGIVLGVGACIVTSRVRSLRGRSLSLVLIPSSVTVFIWFVATPPSFRFAWGPVFSLVIIPIGWSLKVLADSGTLTLTWTKRQMSIDAIVSGIAVISLVAVASYCTVARQHRSVATERQTWAVGDLSWQFPIVPVADAATKNVRLPSGLRVKMPTTTDQCWNTYPLCTAQLALTAKLRGQSIQEGFLP